MKTPKFLKKVDWTDLRTQKTSLLATIEFLKKNNVPQLPDDLEGILALIDAMQDYAVDEMGISEMHVFDLELEDERSGMLAPEFEDIPVPTGTKDSKGNDLNVGDKIKTVMLCSNCGSDNVEMKAWVNPNTDDVGDTISSEDEDCYCNDCKGHHELLAHELKADAKVVGFQIVGVDDTDREGEIHPDMDASFCLYNLSWCRERLHDYYNWRLLTIWEGDVEEPTFMFEGDPRD